MSDDTTMDPTTQVGTQLDKLEQPRSGRGTSRRVLAAGAILAAVAVAALVWTATRRSAGGAPAVVAPASAEGARQLALTPAARAHNPIAMAAARRVALTADLDLVGSATYDGDLYAIVGPLVHGRIVAIHARPGDDVAAGQVLAEIESAEVGQAQAAYIAASARSRVSQANSRREQQLAEQHISSGREREVAEGQAAGDLAEMRAAEQRLLALGLARAEIAGLEAGGRRAGRVVLRAPIAGSVTQRSVALGQAIEAASDCFHVADLRRLWVDLEVFEKDLEQVRVGQRAEIRTESHPGEVFPSRVAWIEPRIDAETRTARVRIEFENRDRKLRPGQFVTAHLRGEAHASARPVIAVPRRAVITLEGKTAVFVAGGEGRWARRPVEVGRAGGDLVEIRAGLAEGEEVVTDGAFLLKSESQR